MKSISSIFRRAFRIIVVLCVSVTAGSLIYFEASRISYKRKEYLYRPFNWVSFSMLENEEEYVDTIEEDTFEFSIGGGSESLLPLDIKNYCVKEGDTLSYIALRFGMDLDTIASMNREWGSGVHLISIGEKIKIPNQDGIFVKIENNLAETCMEKNVPEEVVLQVNRIARENVHSGSELFFPGVQHTGIERSVMTGTAFLRPVRGYITSGFGYRRDPFTRKIRFHNGIDIAASTGTAIRATLDGRVLTTGYNHLFGNYLLIRHQIGYSSLYGHLHKIFVKKGSMVQRGQRIGEVGNSGRSTGPHLHFEIRKNGVPIQPMGLLTTVF